MEAAAQEEVNTTSKDHTVVVKGKRTKRQRLQSPIPFAVAAATNSYGGENNNNHHNSSNSNNNISNNSSSPTTSAELEDISTDEEEDMANCLILLAQGQSRGRSSTSLKMQPPTASTEDGGGSNFKYNSRKVLEATNASGAGKAGYYVYECKTCSRTFPSFQALGGHRASHKKPKAMAEIEKKTQLFALQSDEENQSQLIKSNNTYSSTALSLQLSNKSLYGIGHNNNNHHNNNNNKKSSNKVHECSFCGAEFTSGQALGGHMRRHRAPLGTATASAAATALSLSTVSAAPLMALEANEDDHQQQQHNKKARNVLSFDLDLNLPAPEDDQRELKFGFVTSKQQQQQQPQQQQQQQQPSLVFSSPALVDCHY